MKGTPPPLLHPMQAKAILFVLILVLILETIHFFLDRFFLQLRPSTEEINLGKQVRSIEQESKIYELPATFMKWAKMKREAAKLEKDMLKLQEVRESDMKAPWRKQVQKILGFRQIVLFVVFFFVFEKKHF